MKTMVIFDSTFGNTGRIAESIGRALPAGAKTLCVDDVDGSDLASVDILLVGSPTQGSRPSKAMQGFLDEIADSALEGKFAAAFDTRLPSRLARLFGFAAEKMAKNLETKGARLISDPIGFFVIGQKGPLKEGELERAAEWAREIARQRGSPEIG